MVDRYSKTYGPTDFEYCLLAALLDPNWSSLAIERVGWALSAWGYRFTAVPVEQGLNPDPCQTEKQEATAKGAFAFLAERVAKIAFPRKSEEV